MEQSHGLPPSCGRGRPMDISEMRRPISFPTYAEYPTAEVPTTNGMYNTVDPQWIDQPRGKY